MSNEERRTALDWDNRFKDDSTPWERNQLHPAVELWTKSGELIPGRRILVPGCGRAPELVHFAARLDMKVTGADLSPTAMEWQAEQLEAVGAKAELITGDVFAYTPEVPFDLIYEQTFLCAIPPAMRGDYERCVHAWLKPGGRLLALFMQKEEMGGPPYGCSLDAMRELFPDERWIWPDENAFQAFPHPNLSGKPELAGTLVRR